MNILSLLILGQFLATSLAQLVINGDTRVYAKYARAKALEGAALRRIVNLETSYADRSDMEYANYKKRLDAKTYKDRGSKYTVDGVPIPGNENLDSQVIDPRTPKGFGNPFMSALRKTQASLSPAIIEEAQFWNVSIPVLIDGETVYLPIHNGDFSEALTLWYQNNYEAFVELVENKNFDPKCGVEMSTADLSSNYVDRFCPDHCHCYGHDHNCCKQCQYGKIGSIYECQYYKVIMDAQIAIAQSITYQKRQQMCNSWIKNSGFVGCYVDVVSSRDLPEYMGTPSTTDGCEKKCKDAGYAYMGRQYNNECFCGNSYGKHGSADDCVDCSQTGGFYGGNRNCVFNVGDPETEEETPTGTKTKKQILDNPIGLKSTKEHPMNKDVAISRGVF